MKSISKLKDDGRRHEQREEWEKAIQVYLQVLRISEESETEVELPLFNRIGDLCVRLGRDMDAVRYYEQAADRYADSGLYNNAIALCNKALRYDPDRLELMKKLGQFSASQGFVSDARRYFLDYAERQFNSGHIDDALNALEDFANVSEDAEVRELLGRRLHAHGRTDEAVTELSRAYAMRQAAGETAKAQALRAEIEAIKPSAVLDEAASAAGTGDGAAQALAADDELPGLIDLDASFTFGSGLPGRDAVETPGAPMEGLESGHFEPPSDDAGLEAIEIEDYSASVEDPGVTIEGLESTTLDLSSAGADLEPLDLGFDVEHDEPLFDLPLLESDDDEDGPGFDLPLLDDDAEEDAAAAREGPDFGDAGGESGDMPFVSRVFEVGEEDDPWGIDASPGEEDETDAPDYELPGPGGTAADAPGTTDLAGLDSSLDALLADLRVDDLLDAEALSHEAALSGMTDGDEFDDDDADDDVAIDFTPVDDLAIDGAAGTDVGAAGVAFEDTEEQWERSEDAAVEQAGPAALPPEPEDDAGSYPPAGGLAGPVEAGAEGAFWYDEDDAEDAEDSDAADDLPPRRVLDDVDSGATFTAPDYDAGPEEEPAFDDEPAVDAEPAADAEPAFETQPVIETESAFETDAEREAAAAEDERVFESDALFEAEPVFEREPVFEAEAVDEETAPSAEDEAPAEPVFDAGGAMPEPRWDEPVVDEPVVEEPVAEEPVAEEPVVDEPAPGGPAVDERAAQAPMGRAPSAERDPWAAADEAQAEGGDAEPPPVAPVAPARTPEPAAAEGFIDLAALLADDDEQDGTRFQVQETAPTGDEDRDFAELLSQFKAKVSEHLPREDAAAHYDLALAFKEMGLIDEAIAEFQIALRAGSMRLKVYEELGQCFLLKEQYNIAEKVLTSALEMQYDDELELLGVYYQLGRAYEGLGRREQARDAYERVLGMDINFQDVTERLAQL